MEAGIAMPEQLKMTPHTALADQAPAADDQASPPKPRHDGATTAKLPETLFVLDTTAIAGKGPRIHQMIVAEDRGHKIIKNFTFEAGIPLELPFAIAVKFLKIPAFKRTDKAGDLQPYHRQPKQPHELAAGEKFELKDTQTVADYGELSNIALLQRTLELPGGELKKDADRQGLIDFIVKTTVALREANAEKTRAAKAGEAELTEIGPVDEE